MCGVRLEHSWLTARWHSDRLTSGVLEVEPAIRIFLVHLLNRQDLEVTILGFIDIIGNG